MSLSTGKTMPLFLVLLISFILGEVLIVGYVIGIQKDLIQTNAIERASLISRLLTEFRTLYTQQVVSVVENHSDIKISHQPSYSDKSIPLPATLSMSLGNLLDQQAAGSVSHLISPYPFPWRKTEGGLKDEFQKNAWQYLSQFPQRSYHRFSEYKNQQVLRYATADLMRESCVNCHNNHPNTPKPDWKVGDLRGILEIIQPIEGIVSHTKAGTRGLYLLTAVITLFGIVSFTALFLYFKNTNKGLENKIAVKGEQIKRIEYKLAASEKLAALGQISTGIAHEINQPLGSIKLTAENLARAIENNHKERIESQLSRINRQVERIDQIINQLNVYSQTGKHLQKDLHNINELIKSAVEQMQTELTKNDITLSLSLSAEKIIVKCNKIELERVFINVIFNAIHALAETIDNKIITVDNKVNGDKVCIGIADNGPGISEENQSRIFDPFFSTKQVGQGSGLGLSLCYGIIKSHNGTMELDPDYRQGARLLIQLPITKDQTANQESLL